MGFIKDLFSSPGDKLPSNREMLDYLRSDRVGAVPNVNSRYGSTNVEWDGDQATITQSLAPGYDQLADQQLAYLQGGPQQLGSYSNPSIENLFAAFANRVGNRGGGMGFEVGGLSQPQNNLPQVGPQQMPYNGPQQPPMQAPQQAGPQQGGYVPQEQHGIPQGGGDGGGFENLFNNWFMQKQRPIDYTLR